jgi:hypothetical protein
MFSRKLISPKENLPKFQSKMVPRVVFVLYYQLRCILSTSTLSKDP